MRGYDGQRGDGDEGRGGEDVEPPRVGDAGRDERATEERADDRADATDAGGQAERRAADLKR